MALAEDGKIAVWTTTKQAYSLLWKNRKQHITLSFLALFPNFIIENFVSSQDNYLIIIIFLSYLWSTPLHILWQRLFLIGPDFFIKITLRKFVRIWTRTIDFYLKFGMILILFSVLFFGTIYTLILFLHNKLDIKITPPNSFEGVIIIITTIYIFMNFFIRFMPTIVGISVENRISFSNSWAIMKGSCNHFILIIIPLIITTLIIYSIVFTLLMFFISYLVGTNMPSYEKPLIAHAIGFILSPLITLVWSLPMAAQAIIYRDLLSKPENPIEQAV